MATSAMALDASDDLEEYIGQLVASGGAHTTKTCYAAVSKRYKETHRDWLLLVTTRGRLQYELDVRTVLSSLKKKRFIHHLRLAEGNGLGLTPGKVYVAPAVAERWLQGRGVWSYVQIKGKKDKGDDNSDGDCEFENVTYIDGEFDMDVDCNECNDYFNEERRLFVVGDRMSFSARLTPPSD